MLLDVNWRPFTLPQAAFPGVTCEVKPLSSGALQSAKDALLPLLEEALAGTPEERKAAMQLRLRRLSPVEIMQAAQDALPQHVRNLRGITLRENGRDREATLDELLQQGAFWEIASILLGELVSISRLTADDQKNSAGPSASSPTSG